MKTRTSKLLNDFGISHFITDIHVDLGNNPSQDQLYQELAELTEDFITSQDLNDVVTISYSHNYSHITGKVKRTFSIYDLCDYLR